MNDSLKTTDINAIAQAIIDDDPEAIAIHDSLIKSLSQLQKGQFARTTKIENPVDIRKKTGLSQSQFAKAIGISVNTLKSWEQGQRHPSGSAKVLLGLLAKRPELIQELATAL